VMEAAPPTPFEMSEPELLLELLIVALDAPTQLGPSSTPFSFFVARRSGKSLI